MNRRKILLALAAVVALVFASGCMFPDYQLDFGASIQNGTGNPANVYYTIDNTGSKDLYDVSIEISVQDGGSLLGSAWTSSYDIAVWDSASGNISIYLSGTPANPVAYVSSAKWDDSDSNNWLF